MPPFQYLGNGLTNCVEIREVVRDPFARLLQKLRVGHNSTCARAHPFFVSRERLDGSRSETWCVIRESLPMRFTKDGGYPHESTCSCTHLKHVCSLPLACRPKGVLHMFRHVLRETRWCPNYIPSFFLLKNLFAKKELPCQGWLF